MAEGAAYEHRRWRGAHHRLSHGSPS
jgi:hypothetical protein